jgi:hypothetical protein
MLVVVSFKLVVVNVTNQDLVKMEWGNDKIPEQCETPVSGVDESFFAT